MLTNLSEMRSAVQSDAGISSNSSLYPPATIDLALNRAYVNKITRLFRWPALEGAKYTTSQANINYYDAPSNFTPDSVWRLEIDGVQYGESPDGAPMDFRDYLKWKQDYPDSTDKKWAVQHLRIFVSPTPTTSSMTISIWGQETATKLTNDSDETIFSYNLPEVNEAIVLEAVAILKKKGTDKDKGMMYSDEAKQIVAIAFGKIRQEQGKYRKNLPMLDVPDFFPGSGNTPQFTGNFTNTRSLN